MKRVVLVAAVAIGCAASGVPEVKVATSRTAPPEPGRKANPTFVVHDANTGEVLAARSGSQFTWDRAHHHVAFVVGHPGQQALVVDGKNVWPRRGLSNIHGEPVWSNEGHGIA